MNFKSLIPQRRARTGLAHHGDPFEIMRQEIDRLFDLRPLENAALDLIKVDVREDKNGLIVNAEIPGVKEEDISITVHNGLLTIQGEKKEETEEKEENYYRIERSFGSFSRTFQLPYEADPESAEAEFKNGVLKIKIPRPPEEKTKEKENKN